MRMPNANDEMRFAHTHTHTYLATIDVLDSWLTEYKIDVFTCLKAADKLWQIQPLRIVLIGSYDLVLLSLRNERNKWNINFNDPELPRGGELLARITLPWTHLRAVWPDRCRKNRSASPQTVYHFLSSEWWYSRADWMDIWRRPYRISFHSSYPSANWAIEKNIDAIRL